MQDWRAMSERERAVFEAEAAQQQKARNTESQKTLKEVAEDHALAAAAGQTNEGHEGLSVAQRLRLGQRQLNHSLQALASHPVWQSGLSLSSRLEAFSGAEC